MSRTQWTLMIVAIAAMIAGLAVALRVSPPAPVPAPAAPAPTGVLTTEWKDLDGQPQALAQFKGKLLVLNFWATWCAPCVEEMPDLQRVQDEYAARGVSVIGMGIDAVPAMRRFRDEHKLSLTLLAAAAGGTELARELGNASGALPFTVLIDSDGRIAQRRLGRISAAELRLWLDAKLGPRPG
ncbi:MAG: redoxin family protein [Burkholderiaceae bacterium]